MAFILSGLWRCSFSDPTLYRAVLLLDLYNAHYMSDRKAAAAAATAADIHSFRTNNSLKTISFPLNVIVAYCVELLLPELWLKYGNYMRKSPMLNADENE